MAIALEIPVIWLLLGTIFACIGLLLLGDYRGVIVSNPHLVMSVKVFLLGVLRPTATNVYFGIVLLVLSACLFVASLLALAVWLLGIAAGLGSV